MLDELNILIKTSMCEHKHLEYFFDWADGYPYFEGAECEECGKIYEPEDFSLEETNAICDEERIDKVSSAIDRAVDTYREGLHE